jgi:hypothetical protein
MMANDLLTVNVKSHVTHSLDDLFMFPDLGNIAI